MSYELPIFNLPNAKSDDTVDSSTQFRFVQLSNTGRISKITNANQLPIGVQQDNPTGPDQAMQVMVVGISRVIAGANLAEGAEVTHDANGAAIVRTAGKPLLGRVAPGGAADTGDFATVLINCINPAAVEGAE